MKIQRTFSVLFLTIALVLSNISTALAMPPLPSSFYGTVKLDGANVAVGTIISARIDGVQYASEAASLSGSNTIYSFSVPGDDPDTEEIIEGGVTGDIVVFYIGSYLADQTATWRSGRNTSVNLTAVTNHTPVANTQSVTANEDTAKDITLTGSDSDGDPLTYIIVTGPAHGSVSGSEADQTYTPNANYTGTDSFTFKVNDGTVDSAPATVNITVTAVNDAPVANPQSVGTNRNTPKDITLTGSDVDGDSLTYAIVSGPLHGSLSGSGANRIYTPDTNYTGTDSFTFKVNDTQLDSGVATVDINIAFTNVAPVANAQSVTTNEDTAKVITLTGTDADGDLLTFEIVSEPAHGSLSGSGANQTYTPDLNYNGSDSFTFLVNDDTVDSDPATVSITVAAINDAPIADIKSVTAIEDTSKDITLTGSDVDGDSLTYSIVSGPSHGLLSGTNENQIYTPNTNYIGADSFTFKVNDGTVDSAPATVSITVTAINDAPIANAQSVTTSEDTAKAITLTGTDVEGSTLTFILVSGPYHGSLSGTGANQTYTPDANYHGPDFFIFKVNDGIVDSDPATVDITVTAVNDIPVADPQSVTTIEDTAKDITLTGSDVEGSTLTYVIVTEPAHGSLSGGGANQTYTPDANYTGTDSFTFKVNDGDADSAPATVSITVTAVNDAPIANPQSVSTTRNTPKAITLTGSDVDSDSLTYAIVSGPTHGSLSGSGANQTYTPAINYTGPDSFTFKVNDTILDSGIATVQINVAFANIAPVANAQSVTTNEDTAKDIILTGTDEDGDPLTYEIVTGPTHGSLSGTAPNVTYTPNVNYNGSDTFTFTVNDGTVDSAPATVSITVTAINDVPAANPQAVTTSEDTAKAITLTGTDIDGDPLTYIIVTGPTHGVVGGSGANKTYTPDANYNGADSFTFKVNDGTADSAPATVSITVTAVNDAPIADTQSVNTTRNATKDITLTGSDVEGSLITFAIVSSPLHGTLSGSGANQTYTPNTNYTGPDSFTFKVNDGTIDSAIATVNINVSFTNVAPVANPQVVTVNEDTARDITLTGSDADGDPLTYVLVTGPAHGSVSGSGAIKTYTPDLNYNGSDSFTFKVNDGTIDSAPATVTITVIAANDAPVANAQSATTSEDTPKAITLTGSDVDGNSLTYIIVSGPSHGSLSGSAANQTYTPSANYNGPDSFIFKVNDGTIDSAPATVSITVTAANDAPVANPQSVTTNEDTAKDITLTGTDGEGNLLTFAIISGPYHGSLSGSGANQTYTPALNYNGTDSFTFKVNDGTIDSDPATVSITVTAANDMPVANPQSVTASVDTAKDITLTGSDLEGSTLTYVILTGPTHGSLSGTAPNVIYTSAVDYSGPDSFTFKVNDGTIDSAPAIVSITVVKIDQTITFGALADKILGAADFTVSATADSGLTVGFSSTTTSVCTVSANTVHLITTGTCTIRASQTGNSKYNAAPNVDRSFMVNPAGGTVITVTGITVNNKVYDGSTTATLNTSGYDFVGITEGDIVTLISSGATAAFGDKNVGTGKSVTVSGLTLGGADAYKYTLTQPTGLTANITSKTITITPTDGQSKVYGSADPVFAYTPSPVLFSGDSFSGAIGRAAGSNVNTYAYTLGNLNAGTNYTLSLASGHTFAITAKAASITPNADSKIYGALDPSFSGTLSGFLAGDNVTAVYGRNTGETAGTYTISATLSPISMLGNYNITYNTAVFTINKKTASVTPSIASKIYGTSDPALTGTLSGFLPSDGVTAIYSRTTGDDVGTYPISAVLSPTGVLSNYTITYNTANFTINPASITITAQHDERVYNGTNSSSVAPQITSGTLVTGDTATLIQSFNSKNAGTGKILSAAASTINDGNSGNNYTVTYVNNTTGAITRYDLEVTAVTDSKGYDGTTSSIGLPSITLGTLQGSDTATWNQTYNNKNAGTGKTLTPAGTVNDGNGGLNYRVVFNTVSNGSIAKRAITVTAQTDTREYNGTTSSSVIPTVTTGTIVTGDTGSWTQSFENRNVGTNKKLTPAGSISDGNSGNNYLVSFADNSTGAITIRSITVTAVSVNKVYDGNNNSAGVPTITTGTLATGDTATWTQSFDNKNAANGKTLTPSGAINDGNGGSNYNVTFVTALGNITPADLNITANNKIIIFGGTDPIFDFTVSGFVSPDAFLTTPTCSVANPHTAAGTYPIICSGGDAGTNYTIHYYDGVFTVSAKIILNVTGSSHTITYGDAAPIFTSNITGFVDGDDASVLNTLPTCTAGSGSFTAIGSPYAVACSGGLDDKYDFNYIPGIMTVNPKALTITANNTSKTYGSTATFTGSEFTATGLIGTDTVTSVTLASSGAVNTAAVGTYNIVSSTATGIGLGNYTITYAYGTLTVDPKALTITANNASKIYGATTTFSGSEFNTLGLVNADVVTSVTILSSGAVNTANVGPYNIVPSAAIGTGLGNYIIAYANGTLSVEKAGLTVNADNKTKVFGSVDPTFTFVITGWQNSDTVAGIDVLPTCSVSGAHGAPGTYTIICSGGSDNNYIFASYIDGTLTVSAVSSATFVDVPMSHWAWKNIESLYAFGITGGCSTAPLLYCPDSPVNRAQMAIFLLRGIHGSSYTPPEATGTLFLDVPSDAFAAAWIEQLAAEGITGGCGGGNYCPNQAVTRSQMAIFLVRAKHGSTFSPPPATGVFDDVPVGSFADNFIEQLAADGVTTGCGNGKFCPNATVTRDQMAVFLQRTFELPLP